MAASANSLGALAFRGLAGPLDKAEGVRWFRKAADTGYAPACFNLAMRYLQGDGIAADPAEARRLLERAIAATVYDGQTKEVAAGSRFELGLLYETGAGGPQDVVKALRLFEEASPDNEEARQSFERLKAKLAA